MSSESGIERKYVVGKNGLFEKYEDVLFRGTVKATGCPTAPELKEEAEYIGPKIPARILKTALGFLQWCSEEHRAEGCLLFRNRASYSPEPEKVEEPWEIVCPPQYVGGAHVCYHPDQAESFGVMADIHSHPGFGSGHSATDHTDECKYGGIAIVVSKFKLMNCSASIIGSIRGVRFEFPVETIIDDGDAKGDYSFPEKWKDNVRPGICPDCKPDHSVGTGRAASIAGAVDFPGRGGYGGYDDGFGRSWHNSKTPIYFSADVKNLAWLFQDFLEGRKSWKTLVETLITESQITEADIPVRSSRDDLERFSADDAFDAVSSAHRLECPTCQASIESVHCESCQALLGVDEVANAIVDEVRHDSPMDFDDDSTEGISAFGDDDPNPEELLDNSPLFDKPDSGDPVAEIDGVRFYHNEDTKFIYVVGMGHTCTPECLLHGLHNHIHMVSTPFGKVPEVDFKRALSILGSTPHPLSKKGAKLFLEKTEKKVYVRGLGEKCDPIYCALGKIGFAHEHLGESEGLPKGKFISLGLPQAIDILTKQTERQARKTREKAKAGEKSEKATKRATKEGADDAKAKEAAKEAAKSEAEPKVEPQGAGAAGDPVPPGVKPKKAKKASKAAKRRIKSRS